ncbi:hypothetical protein [Paracoccus sp. T5]|uniref:hypothetical protein n=1 Tax=Paracoccus sp. T5 TaxID=3402161 RepID=UPI003AEC4D5C
MAGRVGNRRLVTAACPAAQGAGLRVGMPVTKAQALVPDLRVELANPREDAASLDRLALWICSGSAPSWPPTCPMAW